MFCPTIQLGLLASIFAASCSGLDVGGSHPETTKPLNTTQHGPDFVPDAVLVVTVENITLPCIEGKRPTVVVNGTLPGPELRIKEGQTTWIRVYNNMSDMNTTMHWHGLGMSVSPWCDGTPLAAQWPIAPGRFFDYELFPENGTAGTYFYHSHVGLQAVTATGPLIVEDAGKIPYHYDEDRIIFVHDIFEKTDAEIVQGLTASPFVWGGETQMILINGKGGGTSNVTASNLTCNEPLSIINVAPGKTYRLRFIGATALTVATMAFQDYPNLTLIEADGQYTKAIDVDHIQIASGQRFSVLLKIQEGFGVQNDFLQVESRERPTVARSFAVLSNSSKEQSLLPPATPPLTLPYSHDWLEYQLAPLKDNNFPELGEVSRRVTVDVHQLWGDGTKGGIEWTQNGIPWFEESVPEPYLVALLLNDTVEFPSYERALENQGIDPVTKAFPVKVGEVLEIVIQNTGATSGGLDVHPFHAHGAHYFDIGSGNGTYDVNANEEKLRGTSPVLRDTTMLPRYNTKTTPNITQGWRAWRLRVSEPGVWMIHCHILPHMVMGMQTVWVVGNYSEIVEHVQAPMVQDYLVFGGNVYGTDDHYPSGLVEFSNTWAREGH